ncbi:MAG: peptidylprolyl isomerase, partial [Planctomycetales bacterium]|nr:peptidylprolyl isomerase [Planctomycetales bacterium]
MNLNRRKYHKHRKVELLEPRVVLSGVPVQLPINDSGSSFPRDFVQVGNVAFFVGNDGVNGRELWKTDGTVGGTTLVLDINPGLGSSDPTGLVEHNGMLYFAADDGETGNELWKSDGTAAGTTLVHDIFPGTGYQAYYGDGPYSSNPIDIVSSNGRLYFAASDKDNGRELWASDGTSNGTVLVKDIAEGADTDYYTVPHSSSPTEIVGTGGMIFFAADDGVNGRELWQSNGTAAGTVMVKDIKTGEEPYYYYDYQYGTMPASSNPNSLTLVDGQLMFTAETEEHGRELWISDGTEAGTSLVRDILPGTDGGFDGSEFDRLIEVDGILFFAGIDDDGRELWTSDGTSNGTLQVSNIGPGADNGVIGTDFVELNNILYFNADDGIHGSELWRSDGTPGGTSLVRDLEIGDDGSYPEFMTIVDSRIFFAADTSDSGNEIFESDGTAGGTFLAGDITSGPGSSFPEELGALDNILLFSASSTNQGGGREAWAIDAEAERDETASATIKIFVDGEEVVVPANIGLTSSGQKLSKVHTTGAGQIRVEPIASEAIGEVTLGDFFSTWRNEGGAAGNNSNAQFSATQLLSNVASGRNTVQMFVNGQASTSFDNYVIRDGDEIVLVFAENAVVSINTNFGSLLFELFEEETPQTVENFLNYVNDGDFNNTFFHRSLPGFVIQGGGFRTSSTTFTTTSQFTAIDDDDPVENEPGISNLRGTVAMAKLGGDPDSATNQFFVNLADNSANLDNQNGGFTVFARVLDMSVVETLEQIPTRDIDGGLYSDLAVTDDDELIVIESIGGTGFVSGRRFSDVNENGVFDASESGLGNEIVYIDDNNNGIRDVNEISTRTDSSGLFRLTTGGAANDAKVRIEPSGARQLTSSTSAYSIDDSIGTISNLDFGEAEPDNATASDDSFTVTNN